MSFLKYWKQITLSAATIFFIGCGDDPSSASSEPFSSSVTEEISSSSETTPASSAKDDKSSAREEKNPASSSSTPADTIPTDISSSSNTASSSSTMPSYFNSQISYGELIDSRDGQVYKTVQIGDQIWMAENNNYIEKHYENFCDYSESQADSCKKYGRLYNSFSAKSSCAEGWHLPSQMEWNTLINYVSKLSNDKAGKALKSTTNWDKGGEGTNLVGFNVITDNYNVRHSAIETIPNIEFWSSTDIYSSAAILYNISFDSDTIAEIAKDNRLDRFVRCIKNNPEPVIKSQDDVLNPDITYDSFTDTRDNQTYKTVTIGKQIWMAQNLNYSDSNATPSLLNNSWCYGDTAENCQKYGRLYNWVAAIDSVALSKQGLDCGSSKVCETPEVVQGICPDGWKLPKKQDLDELNNIGWDSTGRGKDSTGILLKSKISWANGGYGTDKFGFALAANGHRSFHGGVYNDLRENTGFWSADIKTLSTASDVIYAHILTASSTSNGVSIDFNGIVQGYYVRCLKIQ